MALNFAKRSLKLENFSKLLPLKVNLSTEHMMSKRNPKRFNERHRRPAVPFLQRLLNDEYSRHRKDLSKLLQVNNGILFNLVYVCLHSNLH